MSENEKYKEIQAAVEFLHATKFFNACIPNIIDVDGKRSVEERKASYIRLMEWIVDEMRDYNAKIQFDTKVLKATTETINDYKMLQEKLDSTHHDHWQERQNFSFKLGYVFGQIEELDRMHLQAGNWQEQGRALKIVDTYILGLAKNIKG